MVAYNRILLINDNEELSRQIMEQLVINAGYSIALETDASSALANFKENNFDLVMIKLGMLNLESVKLIKEIKNIDANSVIIGLSEENKPELLEQAEALGFYDIFHKPFDWGRIFFATKKAVELHSVLLAQNRLVSILKEQNTALQKQNILLAKRIEESTANLTRLYEDLRSTYMRTIRALAQAIDARDHYTHSHSENVARYAVAIATEMGLSVKETAAIRDASELHDLGKIGISDVILSKPGSLDPQEWVQIKRHPQTGAQILEPLTFLGIIIELVRQHHEHYAGAGYPAGLRGDDILLGARIMHLADAYDSMISARSYRPNPFSKKDAIAEIQRNSGTQFDPKVVDVFLKIVDKL
jgi:putative two-component system response regulator